MKLQNKHLDHYVNWDSGYTGEVSGLSWTSCWPIAKNNIIH